MRPEMFLIFALGLGTVACSGAHEPPRERGAVGALAKPFRDAPGLDVPGLLNLTIDQLSLKMGPPLRVPVGFVDPVLAPLKQRSEELDSTSLFQRRGLSIVATYNYNSRRIIDLLLLGSNEQELMRRAQLRLGADQYLVLPVFQERATTKLLGLRVLAIAMNQ